MSALQKSKKIVTEVKERWVAETPTHFKRIKIAGYILSGSFIIIRVLSTIIPDKFPAELVGLCPEMITTGLAIAGVSKTAKVDKPSIEPVRKNGLINIIKQIF